jgi:hypothetical protein
VKYKFEMNQIDGSEPHVKFLTFRRNVEKLRIGVGKRNADAPAIGIVQRMLHATALSSFNDGVRRYEKVIDQARSTRYNAYLWLTLLQVRQLYVRKSCG